MPKHSEHVLREANRLAEALVGKSVRRILVDTSPESLRDFGHPLFGFELSDRARIWILCDPEGNGPGHLSIEPQGDSP